MVTPTAAPAAAHGTDAADAHAVASALDDIETELRQRAISQNARSATLSPNSLAPQLYREDDTVPWILPEQQQQQNERPHEEQPEARRPGDAMVSLRDRELREFSLALIPALPVDGSAGPSLTGLSTLGLSRNQLSSLPGLDALTSLVTLDISHNRFKELPEQLGVLTQLQSSNAARNFLRPTASALRVPELQCMPGLRILDLTFNRKCEHQDLSDMLTTALLPTLELRMIVSFPPPKGAFVGSCAGERNPDLLRSQLEPWGTLHLRRRLVADFGQPPTDPASVPRAEVMDRLLECYRDEQGDARKLVRVDGTPVPLQLCDEILTELTQWAHPAARNRQGQSAAPAPAQRAAFHLRKELHDPQVAH